MAGDMNDRGPPAFYTVADLAERWRCSAGKVRSMIDADDLPCFKHGRVLRISAETVRAIETAPPPPKSAPTPDEQDAARARNEDMNRFMHEQRMLRRIERDRGDG